MEQISKETVKRLEIDILDYVVDICKKNNLKYHLDYGTLLGAIRHKGFIPWDDDIDISMPRGDYDKLIEIMSSNNNSSRYKLLSQECNSRYFYEFAKVVDSATVLNENLTIDLPEMGVWIDIFPQDYLPKFHKLIRPLIVFAVVMRIFSVQPKFPKKHSKLFYPWWLLARLFGFKPFLKMSSKLSQIAKNKPTQNIGYLAAMTKGKYYWDVGLFSNLIDVDFEGKKYSAPKEYDRYLKDSYGDYMTLPPEDKRITHDFVVYWKTPQK